MRLVILIPICKFKTIFFSQFSRKHNQIKISKAGMKLERNPLIHESKIKFDEV